MAQKDLQIAFVGDVHGSIKSMYEYLEGYQKRVGIKLDAVIQVGDFGVFFPDYDSLKTSIQLAGFEIRTDFPRYWSGQWKIPIPTWFCPGNHEDFGALMMLMCHDPIPNLHVLEDGIVTDVLGMGVGAIWGNYSPRSYDDPSRVIEARRDVLDAKTGLCSKRAMHIYRPAVEALARAGTFDIFITHDAPYRMTPFPSVTMPEWLQDVMGLDRDEQAHGCPGFLDVLKNANVDCHYFGHFHSRKTIRLSEPRIVALHSFNVNPQDAVESREYIFEQTSRQARK